MIKKIILSLALVASMANADTFSKGNKNFGVVLGAGTSYGDNYTILGLSGDYFVIDNLSVGLGYRGWFGSGPNINQVTVASSYFIPLNKKFHPYVGAFVRETFTDDKDNYESYGARAGVAMNMSPNSYVSLGYAYEEYSECTEGRFTECSNSYPEVVFSLSF